MAPPLAGALRVKMAVSLYSAIGAALWAGLSAGAGTLFYRQIDWLLKNGRNGNLRADLVAADSRFSSPSNGASGGGFLRRCAWRASASMILTDLMRKGRPGGGGCAVSFGARNGSAPRPWIGRCSR